MCCVVLGDQPHEHSRNQASQERPIDAGIREEPLAPFERERRRKKCYRHRVEDDRHRNGCDDERCLESAFDGVFRFGTSEKERKETPQDTERVDQDRKEQGSFSGMLWHDMERRGTDHECCTR
ncbi:hypothetical protein HRbin20_01128 [bacterium HR20]|nr:hypothetical protein HRbin20_01128 [bacterium HR20]